VSVSPLNKGTVPWLGQFYNQVTMTDIAAYIAANGITIYNAGDVVWWAHTTAREMINQIEDSGGFNNLHTSTIYMPIK